MRSRLVNCSVVAAIVVTPLAAAAPATAERVVWEPYRVSGFTSPAGQVCTFTLRSEPVLDEELIATWSRYEDGSPRLQTIKGDLRVRYTNLDTGAAREYDLNGTADIHWETSGAYTMHIRGPAAVGFRAGDAYPTGFYAFDGYHVIYTAPDRAFREMRVDAGTEHNICSDLD